MGEIGNKVRPTIGEMVQDSVLKVYETAGSRPESRHACTTEVVPLLGGGLMDRVATAAGRSNLELACRQSKQKNYPQRATQHCP
jgi:hypothetical protein